ncbi:MAG: cyclopropane-fatty-acyl-phospholipid synthase family protein [Pseudomonadota bacterium]
MSVARLIGAVERLPIPDPLLRAGVFALVRGTSRGTASAAPDASKAFAQDMVGRPIAIQTDNANRQHYEIPPEFFQTFLGEHRKYSCGYYEPGTTTLDAAEAAALARTAQNAGCVDGEDILELGCGWGSLSLWLAAQFPAARIHSVSNSASQCDFIRAEAARRGLENLRLTTADMNTFDPGETYDRIVSVEMFEHMSNWHALMERAAGWLRPDGRLFLHVFAHRTTPYRFDHEDPVDWIAQHFFAGGIMPSEDLIGAFPSFDVEQTWRWEGTHYAKTAEAWLKNFDDNRATLTPILTSVYGKDAELWRRRWRLFFLATSGLFGFNNGAEWGVLHALLKPTAPSP